jgi:hypothetical protein
MKNPRTAGAALASVLSVTLAVTTLSAGSLGASAATPVPTPSTQQQVTPTPAIQQATKPAPAGQTKPSPKPTTPAAPTAPAAAQPSYAFNGTGNNRARYDWGSVKVGFLRLSPQAYADGISRMSGANRPSARAVSNAINAQGASIVNNRKLTDMVYVFGQFLDHDLTRTISTTGESAPIAVPTGDPQFDPASTGTATIPFTRSTFVTGSGRSKSSPREQNNWVTGFLDGSQVYGSDSARALALRTMSGGLMKTSAGNMLPFNTLGLENKNDAHQVPDTQMFLAGDVRANENPGLTSLQTLFVREHNRLATALATATPALTDEQLYQKARRTVIAELQWIVYNEYLPALLGTTAMPAYKGYKSSVNPSISNEFATAAYRFGHSMLDGEVGRMNDDGTETSGGALDLATSFFNPTVFDPTAPNHEGDIDAFLKAETTGEAQEVDVLVTDAVRNFLFGPPGAGGLDLAALNIQRGRDHGLADYNKMRTAFGLPKVTSFSQITSDAALAAKLQATYGTVNNIDAWVGGLAENHVAGGSLGSLFTKVIADQFTRLRSGDRLYFEASMTPAEIATIKTTSLSSIIMANTALTTVQANAFIAP